MPVSAKISIDYREFTEMKDRILRIAHVRNRIAKLSADIILKEATKNAPQDRTNKSRSKKGLKLRKSGEVKKTGDAQFEISFTRVRKGSSFNIALWLHEPWMFKRSSYTPSDKNPRVGPRYLSRAYEDNEKKIVGTFDFAVEEYLAYTSKWKPKTE